MRRSTAAVGEASDGGPATVHDSFVNDSSTRKALTASEKIELKEVFNLLDGNSEKRLDWQELRTALRGLGFPVSKNEARRLVRAADAKTGYVTLDEFYEVVEGLATEDRDYDREIKNGFRLFTANQEQHITLASLQQAFAAVGESPSDADLRQMMATADFDGDQKVGMTDFYKIMTQTNLFRQAGQGVRSGLAA